MPVTFAPCSAAGERHQRARETGGQRGKKGRAPGIRRLRATPQNQAGRDGKTDRGAFQPAGDAGRRLADQQGEGVGPEKPRQTAHHQAAQGAAGNQPAGAVSGEAAGREAKADAQRAGDAHQHVQRQQHQQHR